GARRVRRRLRPRLRRPVSPPALHRGLETRSLPETRVTVCVRQTGASKVTTAASLSTSKPAASERVIVLDFGAQYGQLIARRIREQQVYCEVLPGDAPAERVLALDPKAIVLSGGPASVYEPDAPRVDPRLLEAGIPVLGICYGMQLLAAQLGGRVRAAAKREFGRTELFVSDFADLFRGLEQAGGGPLICWMSHGDVVEAAPPGFDVLARTADSPVAAMADRRRKLFGIQCHPEVATRPGAASSCATSCLTLPAAGATGPSAPLPSRSSPRCGRRSARAGPFAP